MVYVDDFKMSGPAEDVDNMWKTFSDVTEHDIRFKQLRLLFKTCFLHLE